MWKDIWQNKGRNLNSDEFSMLDLLTMNGYDTSGDALSVQGWVDYTHYIADALQIRSGDKNLLEIGCGGGIVLKVLSSINANLKIYGLDYSNTLIEIAKRVVKNGEFFCDEAINIDKIFKGKIFDNIISGGVFVYFPSKEYAFEVIKKAYNLLAKGGNLALLDLNDMAKKSVYSKIRKGNMSEDEYNKKYAGLEHLFFDRIEIFRLIESLGFDKIIIENQHIDGYINNECRFNIIALGKK